MISMTMYKFWKKDFPEEVMTVFGATEDFDVESYLKLGGWDCYSTTSYEEYVEELFRREREKELEFKDTPTEENYYKIIRDVPNANGFYDSYYHTYSPFKEFLDWLPSDDYDYIRSISLISKEEYEDTMLKRAEILDAKAGL